MPFNKETDPIAVTVKKIHLKKPVIQKPRDFFSDLLDNEIYMLSFAVDESSMGPDKPKMLDLNMSAYPYTLYPGEGSESIVEMTGDGTLVYAPKNPGSFMAYGILLMEADQDVRDFAKTMEAVKSFVSDAANSATLIGALTSPLGQLGAKGVQLGLGAVMSAVAAYLANVKDQVVLRVDGTLLRESPSGVPYHVNRKFTNSNKWITLEHQVLPLSQSNGQGREVNSIPLG